MTKRSGYDAFRAAAARVADLRRWQRDARDALTAIDAELPAASSDFTRALALARDAGATFGQLAGLTFRAANGRAPSAVERRTEAARLRQFYRRNGVTDRRSRHGHRRPASGAGKTGGLRCKKGETNMPEQNQDPKPYRRTVTTVEEFGPQPARLADYDDAYPDDIPSAPEPGSARPLRDNDGAELDHE